MATANVNADDDHRQYIEHVFDEYHSRLQHYFLVQISSLVEADACVRETICRFFENIEGQQAEHALDYINIHLMRIAFRLRLQKQEELKSRGKTIGDVTEAHNSSFNKSRDESIQYIRERLRPKQFAPRSGIERQIAA